MTSRTKSLRTIVALTLLAVLTLGISFATGGHRHAGKSAFKVSGMYFEGCSCAGPCPCELTGVTMGCQGVGLFTFNAGSTFNGQSLAGVKTAYAVAPGSWVTVYVDAPAAKRAAAAAFMKAALAGFGPIESVTNTSISITGSNGAYSGTVGKVMTIKTVAVLGLDGKTPLTYSNIKDPVHPVIMQGKTVSCTYKDGKHKFDLKDTNAYFNTHITSSGKL